MDPRSTGSWPNNSSPARFASVYAPRPGAAANWARGARHAQLHRTDEDRLNVGIHRVCSDPNTHPEMANCRRRSRILRGSNAATAVGRGRGVGSRSLAQSRHRLTQQRGGINDRYRKGCSHPAKQSTGCPANSRSNVRCTKGRTHAQSQDTAVVQSQ